MRDLQLLLHLPRQEMGGALGASVAGHLALLVLVFVLLRALTPAELDRNAVTRDFPSLVWLAEPGPRGGNLSGGDGSLEPPRRAQIAASEPVPLEAPAVEPTIEPEVLTPLPVRTPDAVATLPGVIAAESASSAQGSGTADGGDSGQSGAVGIDRGLGAGPGGPGGFGGETFQPGNGVLPPRVLHQVRPSYTPDAMRARLRGVVRLECVVLPDGSVGRVRVAQSLDSAFGLDQEAIKAARQWRFAPGTRFGQPVPVLVFIDLEFVLH